MAEREKTLEEKIESGVKQIIGENCMNI